MNFDKYFKEVDGVRDPLSVIATDLEWPERRIWLADEDKLIVERRQSRYSEIERKSPRIGGWQVSRGLYDDISGPGYTGELTINSRLLQELFESMSEMCGKKPLSVLDFGAGRGLALANLLDYPDMVNPAIGVALPVAAILNDVRDRIKLADAVNLAPNLEQNRDARFDVVMSVYGAAHYSPLNRIPHNPEDRGFCWETDLAFGILQAINFLKVGGFAMIKNNSNDSTIAKLLEIGVLEVIPGFDRFKIREKLYRQGMSSPENHAYMNALIPRDENLQIFRLMRRPSGENLKVLLSLDADNRYGGFDDEQFY